MPRITPLTAGLPINAVASGWPRATARAPTSTRNTSIRSRNRLARRILRRSLGIAAASRSAMLLTKPQIAVGAHGDAKRGGLDRAATRVRKPRPPAPDGAERAASLADGGFRQHRKLSADGLAHG